MFINAVSANALVKRFKKLQNRLLLTVLHVKRIPYSEYLLEAYFSCKVVDGTIVAMLLQPLQAALLHAALVARMKNAVRKAAFLYKCFWSFAPNLTKGIPLWKPISFS
jgi:hypothetical protein